MKSVYRKIIDNRIKEVEKMLRDLDSDFDTIRHPKQNESLLYSIRKYELLGQCTALRKVKLDFMRADEMMSTILNDE